MRTFLLTVCANMFPRWWNPHQPHISPTIMEELFSRGTEDVNFWQHHLFLFPLQRSLPFWLFTHLEGTTGDRVSPVLLILCVWAVLGSFDTLDFCFNFVWILSGNWGMNLYFLNMHICLFFLEFSQSMWTGSSCFWCRTGVILVSCVFHNIVCYIVSDPWVTVSVM